MDEMVDEIVELGYAFLDDGREDLAMVIIHVLAIMYNHLEEGLNETE